MVQEQVAQLPHSALARAIRGYRAAVERLQEARDAGGSAATLEARIEALEAAQEMLYRVIERIARESLRWGVAHAAAFGLDGILPTKDLQQERRDLERAWIEAEVRGLVRGP